MKYKIEYVNRKIKPGNYIGMNAEAARQLHIPFMHKCPEHTIVIFRKEPHNVRYTTIRHEEAEKYFAKDLHMNRKNSHNLALKYENVGKPFPKTQIKRNLINMGFLARKK